MKLTGAVLGVLALVVIIYAISIAFAIVIVKIIADVASLTFTEAALVAIIAGFATVKTQGGKN